MGEGTQDATTAPANEPPRCSEVLDLIDDDNDVEPASTSLALAAWEGRLGDVRRLLEGRADPNLLEQHKNACHRPLMAAAASGSVSVVAMLLLAGADPCLVSPGGVVAADLTTDSVICRMLSSFDSKLATDLRESHQRPSDKSSNGEAAARVQQHGLSLIEKAIHGFSAADDDKVVAIMPESDSSGLQGIDARKARKSRQEQAEAERLQRVAQKAAARRGQDEEEAKEKARLQRVAQKVAARRGRTIEVGGQEDTIDDSSSSDSDDVQEVKDRPKQPQRRVCTECVMCPQCGWSGERKQCGVCGMSGVCGGCSTCNLCGRASGFCVMPAVAAVPGMFGASGRPEMSGMNSVEEAFPSAFPSKEPERRRRRRRRDGSRRERRRGRTKGGCARSAGRRSRGRRGRTRNGDRGDSGRSRSKSVSGSFSYDYSSVSASQSPRR
mmetsp:Transcript_51686/g.102774  ORF Transcript_51686/g.102774 Transcript_51686/m.102774 type:complete len:439 (+) Transcript_51686:49-1365(+)